MRALILLAGLLALSGCGPGSGYAIAHDCRAEAGPEPDAGLALFGLVGGLIQISQPEHQAWTDRWTACIAREKALRT